MKDNEFTYYSLRKRISALVLAISFIFFALMLRLFFLQVLSSQALQTLALSQWTRGLPITAQRGEILDCNNVALAVSFTTYDLYFRGKEIDDNAKVASELSSVLQMDYKILFDKAAVVNVSEVLVKMQIDSSTAKHIASLNLSGVYFAESVKRYYPYGDMLTQILGFTTIDNIGQSGLEAYYNKILTGKNGGYYVQSDIKGVSIENSLESYVSPQKGNDITLTIDINIQNIVENTLEKIMIEQKAKSVSAIIINPNNGEIIASSTKPSFDLNNVPRDDVAALMDMTRNKLVTDVYEPGSTFKILTMAAALDSNFAHLDDTFHCSGSHVVDGQKIKCWKTTGHGSQTLAEGLVNSCNVVFMTLAQRMGTELFYDYLQEFNIGQKTNINIAGESAGIVMNEKAVKTVDLARIGFGHAVAVTPMQLAVSVSSVVNGGYVITPTIVKSIENQNSQAASSSKINLNSQTSSIINDMLKDVVNKTGDYVFVPGYDVGGKTGTAQKYENGVIANGKYVSSFVGTYPAENPEMLMLILVDEPGAGAYYGSVVAAPYGKKIFQNIFDLKNLQPIVKVEPQYVKVVDVVNQSLLDATNNLIEAGILFEVQGEGSKILNQVPLAGVTIDENQPIVLIT